MKKILFLLFLCSLSAQVFAQPAEVAAKKIRATEKLSVSGTEVTTIRTAAVDATATHAQLPTAKSVWDALAAFVTTVTTDATLSGAGTSGSPLGIAQQGAATGRVLRWSGTAWVPAQVDAGSLTNTGASAGSYTAPSVTIGPDGRIYTISNGAAGGDLTGPITNLQLIAGAVQTADISNNAISADKIGTGQVTGVKLAQDGATTGQVWKWNGTQWAPGADTGTTYTGSTGISVAGTVITNSAPDQVVTIAGATGTYPSFSLPDNSATNEIELPSQTGNSGKYLTTNGSMPSWAIVTAGIGGTGAANRAAYFTSSTNISYSDNFEYNAGGSNYGHMLLKPAAYGNFYTPLTLKNTSGNTSQRMFQILDGSDNSVVWFSESNGLSINALNLASEYFSFGISGTTPVVRLRTRNDRIEFHNAGYTSKASLNPGTGQLKLGVNGTAAAMIDVVGAGSTAGTLTMSLVNSNSNPILYVYDNQRIGVALSTAPQNTCDINGGIRVRALDTDISAPATSGTTSMVITDANGDLSFAAIPAAGIAGTAAANSVPYWDAGGTALTTGGITKSATELNLENGLGLKLISTGAANMIINATTTAGVIQTYGSVPLKLNPSGNDVYLSNLVGGTGKAVSIAANGLLGVIDAGGTVTTTSVVSANGFSGTVATATTTPAITLSTTVSGMLKGNGTAISAATAGTDYVTPTMSANQVVTTGNYGFTLDATAASGTSNPLVIKGNADGTNSTQAITFQNASGTAQSTVTVTNVATYLTAVAGKNLILGVGTTPFWFKENGSLLFQNLSVNPSAAGNRGGLFYNSSLDRFAYSDGTNNLYLAKLTDVSGSNASYTSSQTLQASVSTVEADANAGAITITLDGTMTPDFTTIIRATRNNTNAVTLSAGSGYVFKVDGDASVTQTSYTLTAGEIVTVRRDGTKIFINK